MKRYELYIEPRRLERNPHNGQYLKGHKAYKDSDVSGREYKRIVEYVEAMYADLEKEKSEIK